MFRRRSTSAKFLVAVAASVFLLGIVGAPGTPDVIGQYLQRFRDAQSGFNRMRLDVEHRESQARAAECEGF
jgi:hypothetical protein